jgi:hypothetical protein
MTPVESFIIISAGRLFVSASVENCKKIDDHLLV